jgi:Tol biopolymer transport system component
VFLDLYLADATTGKRIKRLTKSTLSEEFEELRYAYSQGAFSPDGRFFAFTAQRKGKDVLYIYDVRRGRVARRLDTPLQAMLGPSWSPDGRQLVFSGAQNGMTDLYLIDADGRNLQRLTQDAYGDLQPQWSPDGRYIAFASERGPQTDLASLKFGKWQVSCSNSRPAASRSSRAGWQEPQSDVGPRRARWPSSATARGSRRSSCTTWRSGNTTSSRASSAACSR